MRWLSVLVLAVALVAAGCGGGDDESAAVDETTTTVEETTTEETSGSGEFGALGDEDCLALVGAGAAFAQTIAGASGTTDDSASALQELVDRVPDEIKADVQVLAQAYAKYLDKLQELGIEPGTVPSADQIQAYQQAVAALGVPEVTAASERLSAWADEHCPSG